jgi:probable rRNA maturation factor
MIEFPSFPSDQPEVPVTFQSEDVDFGLPHEVDTMVWLQHVADTEQRAIVELCYIFCSDDYLLDMNNTYLNHDYYTDVITFQHTDGALHGDIFISIERVADNAVTNGVSFDQELHRVMVHGLLHLAGYGDKTPEEQARMREKEDTYLAQRSV